MSGDTARRILENSLGPNVTTLGGRFTPDLPGPRIAIGSTYYVTAFNDAGESRAASSGRQSFGDVDPCYG
jgi:hypothetical protein